MSPSGADEVRAAVRRVVGQLERPLADTWGFSLHGHVATLVERLGAVASAAQQVTEGEPDGRENLVKQLAELAANTVVMLVEASTVEGRKTMNLLAQRRITNMNESARGGEPGPMVGRPADDDVVLLDARGRQVNPLPTTMNAAEALKDSLGPRTASLTVTSERPRLTDGERVPRSASKS